MTEHNITLAVGATKVLHTAGTYCDRDIVVTAEKGDGYDNGYNEGLEAGKKAEYDAFWDMFQENGNRVNYQRAFAIGWTDSNYNPKYPIVCGNVYEATEMFESSKVTDTKVPITLRNTRADSMFYKCTKLRRVHLLICENVLRWHTTFRDCAKLEEINIQGEIGTSVDISPCPLLAAASVQSIIDHLKDLTGATAQTLTFHATVGGKMTDEQKVAIAAKNWTLVY